MGKGEISWKRTDDDGTKWQVYAKSVGRDWRFYIRERRFDPWEPLTNPPLEDWMQLLEGVERRVPRRLLTPQEAKRLKNKIKELYPEATFEA